MRLSAWLAQAYDPLFLCHEHRVTLRSHPGQHFALQPLLKGTSSGFTVGNDMCRPLPERKGEKRMRIKPRYLAFIVAMLATGSAVSALSRWTTNAPVPFPFGREGACVADVGDTIFFIAGFGPFGDSTTNSAYDIAHDSWTVGTLAPIPGPPRSEVSGVSHGGSVFCLGGRFGTTLNLNQRYDPSTNTWTTLAPIPIPVDAEYSAVVVGDQIHIIGGRTDGATVPFSAPKTSAHQVYDIASDTWSAAAALPGAPRSDMCAVEHGNLIYVIGGNVVPFDGAVATVNIFDVAAGTWSFGPSLPAPRANASCAVLGNSIYVIGGVQPFGLSHTDTFRFDIDQGVWSVSTPKPTVVAETPGVPHGDHIFVIGGGFFGSGSGPVGMLNQSFKPTPP